MGDVCVSGDMWSEVRIFENIAHTSIHNLRAENVLFKSEAERPIQ